MMTIPIPRILAKPFLWLQNKNPRRYLVMCRGYNADDENFTELVWEDDKGLNFCSKQDYPDFQIWINRNILRRQ